MYSYFDTVCRPGDTLGWKTVRRAIELYLGQVGVEGVIQGTRPYQGGQGAQAAIGAVYSITVGPIWGAGVIVIGASSWYHGTSD